MNKATNTLIGLEIHCQLNTHSKLFCGCATAPSDIPNSRTCDICLGMPGSKPVLNKKAIEYATKVALALNGQLANSIHFSRKTYFYPDLAKNYQITQYEQPLSTGGSITLDNGKIVRLKRIHVEEDPAALIHDGNIATSTTTLIDYNRSGIPLIEIVTEPDMHAPEEAREFMKKLITILNYLHVYDINTGTIKADANVSIAKTGNTRVEIKNITGFKEIERALTYEITRQEHTHTKEITQETRGWDSNTGITFSMRTKETEEDYGYIVDTDLPEIELKKTWIDPIKKTIPKLGHERAQEYVKKYNVDKTDAEIIANDLTLAELFEHCIKKIDPILTSRWFRRELKKALNKHNKETTDINHAHLIELLNLIFTKKITDQVGQQLLDKLVREDFDPRAHITQQGIKVITDTNALENMCKETIASHPDAVNDYKKGEEKALNYLIGKVMARTKGQAKPDTVRDIMKKLIPGG